ncbi:MAG: SH3 domain-containing protein [Alphaproteobacteria bacterium]
MIASHYVEPLVLRLVARAELREAPSLDSPAIRQLEAGERFALLDDSTGWAWGYAGAERRVGYVPAEALSRST